MFRRFVFRDLSVNPSAWGLSTRLYAPSASRLLAILSLMVWLVPWLGCGLAKPMPQTVKIGLVAPFEGPGYDEGYRILFAVKLALREWNSNGGAPGYRVELVAYDEREEGLEAQKLTIDPEVMGVLGYLTGDSFLIGAPHYHEAGLAVIPVGAFPDEASDSTSRGVIVLTPSEGSIGRATVHFLKELGKKRPGVIKGPTRHDQRVAEAFLEEAATAGVDVVLNLSLSEEERYEELLAALRSARTDIVFFIGPPNMAAALWKEVQKKGGPFLFASQRGPLDFLRISDPHSRGVYYVGPYPPPTGSSQWARFERSYQAMGGGSPSPWAALAYDGANILLKAIEVSLEQEGAPSRAGVLRGLEGMKDYAGVTGKLAFNGEGGEPRVYFYSLAGQSFPGDVGWAWPP